MKLVFALVIVMIAAAHAGDSTDGLQEWHNFKVSSVILSQY